LSKSCQKSCKKVVKKLSKSCQKSCQKVVKNFGSPGKNPKKVKNNVWREVQQNQFTAIQKVSLNAAATTIYFAMKCKKAAVYLQKCNF
jgi:hypothetical protein